MAPSPPGGFPSRETHGENTDDMEDSGLTRTCHLWKSPMWSAKGKSALCLLQTYLLFATAV